MPRWTSQAREKQRELIKKWAPWESSTGPVTEKGKSISRNNAYKYGFRSTEYRQLTKQLGELDQQRRELFNLEKFQKNFEGSSDERTNQELIDILENGESATLETQSPDGTTITYTVQRPAPRWIIEAALDGHL